MGKRYDLDQLLLIDDMPEIVASYPITPIEEHGGFFCKREDLYEAFGVYGSKCRACHAICRYPMAAKGIVTGVSRQSPQAVIVSRLARGVGLPAAVFMPFGPDTEAIRAVREAGIEPQRVKPGYLGVVACRAREYAEANGMLFMPIGFESRSSVELAAAQVANIPPEAKRLVVTVGSGLNLAGILQGLWRTGRNLPVLGIIISHNPIRALKKYAPSNWAEMVTFRRSDKPYHKRLKEHHLGDLDLDPQYEAKCLPFLERGDLFWVIGYGWPPPAKAADQKEAKHGQQEVQEVGEAQEVARAGPLP
jgi:hypothetical protein